jgi:proline iminopeptidase
MIDQTLRFLRRTPPGGAIEYLAQFLIGLLHPELLRSEATSEEEHQPLPGDDLVPQPTWEATRAVSINAPAAEVWPWVEQMGYGRGGWYGWNPLEREDTGKWTLLTGLQPLNVGDILLDGPGCDETRGAWKVEAVEPPQALVLHTVRDPVTGRELDPADKPHLFIDTVWTFHLNQISTRRTRLLDRARVLVEPRWALLPLKWMGGGDTVMQCRLLDGIKARTETIGR